MVQNTLIISEIVKAILLHEQRPVMTDYDLGLLLRRVYAGKYACFGTPRTRKPIPSDSDLRRAIQRLRKDRVIRTDPDFPHGVVQVFDVLDQTAELVCAEVDPYCYISHQSAMQRYGLSDRNPAHLVLTTYDDTLWRQHRGALMAAREAGLEFPDDTRPMRQRVKFPDRVRGRPILIHETKYPGASQPLADSRARVATIGQTFLDMLTRPAWCGGMSHVLDLWDSQAKTYHQEIIAAVETCPVKLVKVRAGYILSERLGVTDPRVEAWHAFAQRGSSQKLDPERPYQPIFSERWMLSLNV